MITIVEPESNVGFYPYEVYGLSTDEKPVRGITNASIFYEMDTRNAFIFDQENSKWWPA